MGRRMSREGGGVGDGAAEGEGGGGLEGVSIDSILD